MIPSATHLLLAGTLAVAVALAARHARALSSGGAGAAGVVGFLVFGLAGGPGAAALLLFFVSSSLLSRWRKRDKERFAWEKGGERDGAQVLANGGVAALCALGGALLPEATWPRVALLGALAAANADTWATEIGALASRPPRMITTLRPAPAGASGAVSVLGTWAAFAGAFVVALVGLVWAMNVAGVAAAAAGGFVGALADSFLGATVQAQYRCSACGTLSERRVCCDGTPTVRVRGIWFVGNDLVNTVATVTGAVLAALLFVLFQR